MDAWGNGKGGVMGEVDFGKVAEGAGVERMLAANRQQQAELASIVYDLAVAADPAGSA